MINREAAQENLMKAMHLFVGRGKAFSAQSVADATGIPKSCLDDYRAGVSMPSVDRYLRLSGVLGAQFMNATMRGMGLEVRSTEAQEISPHELMSEGAAFNARLAKMLEDGRIDHREAAELKGLISDLQETLSGYQAKKGG